MKTQAAGFAMALLAMGFVIGLGVAYIIVQVAGW